MKAALLGLALGVSFLPHAHADDCMDKASSQADMNECADISYKASNATLNKLYAQIQQRLKDDPDTRKLLLATQRAWIAYRDAECNFAASATSGGSAYPMIAELCLDGMTQKRIGDLKSYLDCKEGDMACPVPTGK
jgi:uncharacterized protein YecT (DUF1311 family)